MTDTVDIQVALPALGLAAILLLLVVGAVVAVILGGKNRRVLAGIVVGTSLVLIVGGTLAVFRASQHARVQQLLALRQETLAQTQALAAAETERARNGAARVAEDARATIDHARAESRALVEQTRQQVLDTRNGISVGINSSNGNPVTVQIPQPPYDDAVVNYPTGSAVRHVQQSFNVSWLAVMLIGMLLGGLILVLFARRGGMGAVMFAGLGLACVGFGAILLLKVSVPHTTVQVSQPLAAPNPPNAEQFWTGTTNGPAGQVRPEVAVNVTSEYPAGSRERGWGLNVRRVLALALTVLGACFLLKGSVHRRHAPA
ncbi:MAG: hypothetical protein JXO22_04575 [Phycisphaerae bacterium]|nr:hypothetical protein [Phycisphaerae bacterium]